ncbi:MAG: Ig-like domain-containing protein [Bacteroidota bacterium]
MNVSLRHIIAFWCAFLTVLTFTYSQDQILDVYRGNTLKFEESSPFFVPQIITAPENGTAYFVNLGNDVYELNYEPSPSFIGSEMITFQYFDFDNDTTAQTTLYINVLPSKVMTRRDFVGCVVGLSIDIDVINNDSLTANELTITSISLANNGSANIIADGSLINFIPEPNFTGITHFNYIVCDEYGSCDQGTVTVNVYEETSESDTITIFSKKNIPQSVFIPTTFNLTQSPANGVIDTNNEIPIYYPNTNFVGTDYIAFESGGTEKVVKVKILDLTNNTIAIDDNVYTTSYSSVEFNILENDKYGNQSGCFTNTSPRFGSLEVIDAANGLFEYTPYFAGFYGVDQFTYTVNDPNCQGTAETATVYIFVSNFEPVRNRFVMATAKETPIVVSYGVPIDNYEFSISTPAQLGTIEFLSGLVDTIINGKEVRGYNILVYTPNEGQAGEMDEFELLYCVKDGQGVCQYQKFLKIEMDILDLEGEDFCFMDCIWPGDTNLDGIVDINDLLPIGLYMGETGNPRTDNSYPVWYGEYGDDWGTTSTFSGGDIKHVDTDGDSIITAIDTAAILANYNRTHSLTPTTIPFSTNNIILQGSTSAYPGDVMQFDILLGHDFRPAEDVYGITFPIQYNPDIFDPAKVDVTFDNSSWLSYDAPTLDMTYNDGAGRLDAGITRTNGISATGLGKIGKLSVVVTIDIDGIKTSDDTYRVGLG